MMLLLDSEVQEEVPLVTGERGVVLIAGRAPPETVVATFNRGERTEEITTAHSSLAPSDVYALLTYYLRHAKAVDEYVSTHPEWFTFASETR